jgi:hypothetical protein
MQPISYKFVISRLFRCAALSLCLCVVPIPNITALYCFLIEIELLRRRWLHIYNLYVITWDSTTLLLSIGSVAGFSTFRQTLQLPMSELMVDFDLMVWASFDSSRSEA